MDFILTQTLGISSPTHFTKQEIAAKCDSSQYQVNYASIQRHLPVDLIGSIPTLQKPPNFSLWRAVPKHRMSSKKLVQKNTLVQIPALPCAGKARCADDSQGAKRKLTSWHLMFTQPSCRDKLKTKAHFYQHIPCLKQSFWIELLICRI